VFPVNGATRSSVVRLNADGTPDGSFLNGPFRLGCCGDDIWSLTVQSDGRVVVGGSFTTINGVPAAGIARLWGSADIPTRIHSLNRSGAAVTLTWEGLPNRTYRVQYKETLSANRWTDLSGDISTNTGAASKIDSNLGNASQRFYRVVLLP
jgi:hypothetical protein